MMKRNYWKYFLLLLSLNLFWACDEKTPPEEEIIPTDYASAQNWMKLGTDTEFDVDVFYLYPTSWAPAEEDGAFCEIDNASMCANVPGIYASTAKILEDIANVYDP